MTPRLKLAYDKEFVKNLIGKLNLKNKHEVPKIDNDITIQDPWITLLKISLPRESTPKGYFQLIPVRGSPTFISA